MTMLTTTAPLLGEPLPVELMNTIWADREGVHDALTTPAEAAAGSALSPHARRWRCLTWLGGWTPRTGANLRPSMRTCVTCATRPGVSLRGLPTTAGAQLRIPSLLRPLSRPLMPWPPVRRPGPFSAGPMTVSLRSAAPSRVRRAWSWSPTSRAPPLPCSLAARVPTSVHARPRAASCTSSSSIPAANGARTPAGTEHARPVTINATARRPPSDPRAFGMGTARVRWRRIGDSNP